MVVAFLALLNDEPEVETRGCICGCRRGCLVIGCIRIIAFMLVVGATLSNK